MDPILLTIAFKGVAALLAIICGFLVARYGFHLYKDGAGAGRDAAAFQVGPIKMKAQSVGSVVMGTAFLWAWAGVVISPNLDKKGDDWKISSSAPNFDVRNLVVSAQLTKPNEALKSEPERLKKLFEIALVDSKAARPQKSVRLDGKPATYDLQSIQTLKTETGQYLVTTEVKTTEKTATVAFQPMIQSDRIVFIPAGIGFLMPNENK